MIFRDKSRRIWPRNFSQAGIVAIVEGALGRRVEAVGREAESAEVWEVAKRWSIDCAFSALRAMVEVVVGGGF